MEADMGVGDLLEESAEVLAEGRPADQRDGVVELPGRQGPGGRGRFDVGPSRRIIISPDPMLRPRGFIWLQEADRVLVRWNWGGWSHLGLVLDVATGEFRMPTKEEAVWLLENDQLDKRYRRMIWMVATEELKYDMPEGLRPADRPEGAE